MSAEPITNYQSLKDAVGRWLYRLDTDPDIDDRTAELIQLGEARIRRNQEWFTQVYSLENSGSALVVTASPIVLPGLIKQMLNIWASSGAWKHTIEIVPISQWRDLAASNRDASGIPTKAVVIPEMDGWPTTGAKLYLWPQPSTDGSFAIDFKYIKDLAPLSASNPTNGLLTRHPDLYLYAALAESAPFYQHDERLPLWEQRYQQIVRELNIERERAEFGGGPKRPRLPRSF